MSPKRLAENPPRAASSTDEEEEEEEEEEGEGGASSDEEQNGSEKETDDDDDGKEEKSSLQKKSTAQATPEKSESATESDSESTQPSPSASAFTIKHHRPPPQPINSVSKRPSEPESESPASNKKRKGGGGDDGETKNKGAIQRLWSEDDEIAILRGLSQYKSEKGTDPCANMAAFHAFIKNSLHVDVAKNQLINKIRRLKEKYRNNLEKTQNGEEPVFTKHHDSESFELSRKVWDENGKQRGKRDENGKQSGEANPVGGVTLALPSQVKGHDLKAKKPNKKVLNEEENSSSKEKIEEKYQFLKESFKTLGLSPGIEVALNEKLGMMFENGKLNELENKWKRLKEAELELFVQRLDLVNEQVKLTLDLINFWVLEFQLTTDYKYICCLQEGASCCLQQRWWFWRR